MPRAEHTGIFILSELTGPVADRIRAINAKYDPKLARSKPPHITITGSSGAGPLRATVTPAELREALEPITSTTAPIQLTLGRACRFLGTQVIVLPLDPHGPLRVLHDRIATSGLPFPPSRFTFSPHVTLSLYPSALPPREVQDLLAISIPDVVTIDAIQVYHSRDPQPSRKILELPLTGEAQGGV